MSFPVIINLDLTPGERNEPGAKAARLPEIYQGAPYDQTIKVRSADTGTYRDFSGYDEIRMNIAASMDSPALLVLSTLTGTITGSADSLRIHFPASTTSALSIASVNPTAIGKLRFVHAILLLEGGVVVERFAQGAGQIVANVPGAA